MFWPQFIVQECEEGVVAQPKEDSLTIFVRRWYPDKWEFGKFQEITMDSKLIEIGKLLKLGF